MPPLKHRNINSSGRNVHGIVMDVDGGDIDLSPPYQRGDVWTAEQRVKLIKSILLGVPVAAIVLNRRGWNDAWEKNAGALAEGDPYWACIDGKQRLTTLRMWMRSDLTVPAGWFWEGSSPDFMVTFEQLGEVQQRWWRNSATITVAEGTLSSVAEEAEVYDLINSAGTAHTDVDLERARRVAVPPPSVP